MHPRRSTQSPPGAPLGLEYLPDFITAEEETVLLTSLEQLDWDGRGLFKRRGRVVKRREIDFIHDYGRHSRKVTEGPPLPSFLEPLRERCGEMLGLPPEAFQQVICSLYRPGAGIEWHIDANVFGDFICGLSLASTCTMQFRPRGEGKIWKQQLEPRSLLVLSGPARFDWSHKISPAKEVRYSVTLRPLMESDLATGRP